jgi:hypothetical protein
MTQHVKTSFTNSSVSRHHTVEASHTLTTRKSNVIVPQFEGFHLSPAFAAVAADKPQKQNHCSGHLHRSHLQHQVAG